MSKDDAAQAEKPVAVQPVAPTLLNKLDAWWQAKGRQDFAKRIEAHLSDSKVQHLLKQQPRTKAHQDELVARIDPDVLPFILDK